MLSTKVIAKRILISLLLGLLLGVAVSEIPFLFLRESARPPQEIVLTIPAGTAERVSRGEQPPSIPQNMIFVVGDTLVVNNQDAVDHKLGPVWIPANSSAQLSSIRRKISSTNAHSNQAVISVLMCENRSHYSRGCTAFHMLAFPWAF